MKAKWLVIYPIHAVEAGSDDVSTINRICSTGAFAGPNATPVELNGHLVDSTTVFICFDVITIIITTIGAIAP